MPVVGGAIGALLGIGGGFTLGGIGAALLKVAAGIGLTYAARALAGKPDDLLGKGSSPSGTQLEVSAGDSLARTFIVGKWATAGQIIYMKAWGEVGDTPHAYLVQVIKLSDLPISEVNEVFIDGVKVTWEDGHDGKGYSIPEYRKENKDYLWVKIHKGNQNNADDYLVNKFNDAGGKDWGVNHIGIGVAYAIVTSRTSDKFFSGSRPEALFSIDGLKLYNVTKDGTAGGAGGHLWDNPDTWEWTANPAVIIYNLMRGIRYKGVWQYGLQTVTAAQLPFSSWAAAINECALTVTNNDGSTNQQYRCGAEISMDTEVGLEIDEFLKSCNGRIADCGGIYKPKVGAQLTTGTATFSFIDDSLMLTDEHEMEMFPSLDEVINGIDATYVEPSDSWQEKALKPRRKGAYVTEDDGRENVADVTYAHVYQSAQAQRLSKAILNESRRFIRHVVVLPPEAFAIEPLDFVSWTSSRNGYVDKLFRVESVADRANGDQVVGLQEVDPDDYNWDPNEEIIVIPGSGIRDVAPPQTVVNFQAVGVLIDGGTSTDKVAIYVTWDGNNLGDVDRIIFEVRFGTSFGPLAVQDQMMIPESGEYYLYAGLTSGLVYAIRAKYGNSTNSRDFEWSEWETVTTPDTPIFLEEFADELQALILAGSASGAVITEKVEPTPAGFENLYRITVYGTGANAATSAGYYLFVDANGVPGALIDVTNVAMGSLATRQFPFVIEGNTVKLKNTHIQALQAGQIQSGIILASHLAVGAVTAAAVAAGAITTAALGPAAVNASKLAASSVTANAIAAGQVTSAALSNAAVTAGKIAAAAVSTANIQDAAITTTKIATGSIYAGHIVGGQILGGHIQGGVISTTHIQPLAVSGDKIAQLTITATNIASGAIEADKIYAGDAEFKKIKANQIKGGELSTRYVDGANLSHSGNKASVTVDRKGGVILIGTFTYKCNKGDRVEVAIYKKGSNNVIADAKFKVVPGDDLDGAGQVITLVDQREDLQVYELRGDGTTADVDNYRMVALRVAP